MRPHTRTRSSTLLLPSPCFDNLCEARIHHRPRALSQVQAASRARCKVSAVLPVLQAIPRLSASQKCGTICMSGAEETRPQSASHASCPTSDGDSETATATERSGGNARVTQPAHGTTRMSGGQPQPHNAQATIPAPSTLRRVLVPPSHRPPSQSPVPHLSVTHLSTWGSSLSSRHLSHRPQAVPSNPDSARLTSALHSETATERKKHAAVRLRRGWVEGPGGESDAACTRYDYDVHDRSRGTAPRKPGVEETRSLHTGRLRCAQAEARRGRAPTPAPCKATVCAPAMRHLPGYTADLDANACRVEGAGRRGPDERSPPLRCPRGAILQKHTSRDSLAKRATGATEQRKRVRQTSPRVVRRGCGGVGRDVPRAPVFHHQGIAVLRDASLRTSSVLPGASSRPRGASATLGGAFIPIQPRSSHLPAPCSLPAPGLHRTDVRVAHSSQLTAAVAVASRMGARASVHVNALHRTPSAQRHTTVRTKGTERAGASISEPGCVKFESTRQGGQAVTGETAVLRFGVFGSAHSDPTRVHARDLAIASGGCRAVVRPRHDVDEWRVGERDRMRSICSSSSSSQCVPRILILVSHRRHSVLMPHLSVRGSSLSSRRLSPRQSSEAEARLPPLEVGGAFSLTSPPASPSEVVVRVAHSVQRIRGRRTRAPVHVNTLHCPCKRVCAAGGREGNGAARKAGKRIDIRARVPQI
ncbi:hypothetical protein B0H13DRAFT_2292808 [Mycena leptocephala]|nr:hypothetical protein B0H13DRAFT_2292808 [Mycena leptocephala]